MNRELSGSCACGKIRVRIKGSPKRVGICHCMTCRKSHASAFNPFAVFHPQDVIIEGMLNGWESSPGYMRKFCPDCGSHVMGVQNEEVEISLGCLDTVGTLQPQYESWIIRREPWLMPLETPQHERDRVL